MEQNEYEFDNDEDGEEQALTQYARSLSIAQPVKKYKFTQGKKNRHKCLIF